MRLRKIVFLLIFLAMLLLIAGLYYQDSRAYLSGAHLRTIIPLEEYRQTLEVADDSGFVGDKSIATQPGAWTIWFIDEQGINRQAYIGDLDGNKYALTMENGQTEKFVFHNLEFMPIYGEMPNPFRFPTIHDLKRKRESGE